MIKFTTTDKEFIRELRDSVSMDSHISEGRSKQILFAKAIMLGLIAISSYSIALFSSFSLITKLCFSILYGATILFLAINLSHDAVHHSVFKNRKLNKFIHHIIFTLLGVDPYLWSLRHVKSHHPYPNVNGVDVDIEDNLFIRLSPHHSCHWYQKYQHYYAWFLYGLTIFTISFYEDYKRFFTGKMANINNIPYSRLERLWFFCSKITCLFIYFIIPYTLTDLTASQILIGGFITFYLVSTLFILLLVGTHFFDQAEFPEPNQENKIEHSHFYHQLCTSLDWNPNSKWISFLFGGINAHAAHHLFPSVSHMHYHKISKHIQAMTKKHQLPYNQTGFFGMIKSHFNLLKRLGKKPQQKT